MQVEGNSGSGGNGAAYLHDEERSAKIPLKGKLLFKLIKSTDWDLLADKYDHRWLNERLESYAKRMPNGPIAFNRLQALLVEDWPRTRPTRDYRRESEESERKRREWEEVQKQEAGLPDPPELLANRIERLRRHGISKSVPSIAADRCPNKAFGLP